VAWLAQQSKASGGLLGAVAQGQAWAQLGLGAMHGHAPDHRARDAHGGMAGGGSLATPVRHGRWREHSSAKGVAPGMVIRGRAHLCGGSVRR
jgi:hypothetical protein